MSEENLHLDHASRSHWGWGHTSGLADVATRRGLAAQLGGLLGTPAPLDEPLVPVPLEAATVRPSRVEIPAELAAICDLDAAARARRSYGKAYPDQVRAFFGDFAGAPDVVARPRDEHEVEALLAWASRAGHWVVPVGGGTSVVGGLEPRRDSDGRAVVALDLGRLDRVLEVDPRSRAARIQAGALGPHLEAQLGPHGMSLRFYPQSFQFSTLGGWIATRAGGHFATLYTHIDDLVESIRLLTPSGAWQSRRLPASGAGPSPDRLALGSEGSLGVITEAWVRVQPRPRWRASTSVRFAELAAAVDATCALAQSGLHPANCRLLDPREAMLNLVGTEATLVLAFESADHPLQAWMERAVAICTGHGGVAAPPVHKDAGERARSGGEADKWRDAFLRGPYLQSSLLSMGFVVDTFETACTWDRFPTLDAEIRARVGEAMQKTCGGGSLSCRFTHVYPDGPAPYYTFIAPGGRDAKTLIERWSVIKAAACEAIERFGGTITHHHAVGRTHRGVYEREVPAPFLRGLRALKRELDPAGVMNPGVLLDA